MMFAATWMETPTVPKLTDSVAAAMHIAGNTLADGAGGKVGLEIEAHCFDLARPERRPDWERLTGVIAALPRLPGGSAVTVEPGGAVELSGVPADGPIAAIAALAADRAVLRTAFLQAGLGLVLLGCDPLRAPERVNPGGRYRAMEAFFAASGTGAAGLAMMTSTASVQVNVDAGPRSGWRDRVRLAHALGPTMIAIAANSPLLSGGFTGWLSSRQQVWGALDSARCGPVLAAGEEEPDIDWARYALQAPVMLVHSPEPEPVRHWVPFAHWADGRVLLAGRRATTADLDYHLTTLFPPVRPRGWLEIRYLDAVPDVLWPALVFTLVTLLDDEQAAGLAAEAVEPVAAAWDTAARVGLGDRHLRTAANRCVAIAGERTPPEVAGSMALLTQMVERGRCPADDFAEHTIRTGISSAVVALAEAQV
jgi:glutamate--cysteine ligase